MSLPYESRHADAPPPWKGATALSGGKAYARCPLGSLHYRRLPDRAPRSPAPTPWLLLHQTPLGLCEWQDVQPLLAASGRTVIAPDNPGYGMSDAPPPDITVAQLADNLLALLDQLEVAKAIVAGHHTGAALAAALAARHPDRVAALVLHGCPLYSASERAERLSRSATHIEPRADGEHLAATFRRIRGWATRGDDAVGPATWATIGGYLAGASTPTYRAVFANDMSPDVAKIAAPTLVLTDRADRLHPKDLEVAALRADFELTVFSDDGPFALMQQPERWVELVSAFVNRLRI